MLRPCWNRHRSGKVAGLGRASHGGEKDEDLDFLEAGTASGSQEGEAVIGRAPDLRIRGVG